MNTNPIVIIGNGIAGLFCALRCAPHPVIVISPQPMKLPSGTATNTASSWAQGGVAAAIGADDSPALHLKDTLAAGAYLNDRAAAELITDRAAEMIEALLALGVPFDRSSANQLTLGLEAAHSRHRIVRIKGDTAGARIMASITHAVLEAPHIQVMESQSVVALARDDYGIHGACIRDHTGRSEWMAATRIVLATGGVGGLYRITTNPTGATGSGIAMAHAVGATLADMEFVQFHPTAIDVGIDPAPLATEALRGEGARRVNNIGESFMQPYPLAELEPRDIVARAIHRQYAQGHRVYLDTREAIGESFPVRFPTVYAACIKAALNPATDLIPVAPAAHYHIGGVATGLSAQTSVEGLYACGEVAATGAHGANRLASNSLLESLVFADQAAQHLLSTTTRTSSHFDLPNHSPDQNETPIQAVTTLRQLMQDYVGIERDATGLTHAISAIDALAEQHPSYRFQQMLQVCRMIAECALERRESIGCHFRSDAALHPEEITRDKQSV